MKRMLPVLAVVSIAVLNGCGSSKPMLNPAAQSEAESLKTVCMENAIQSDEVIRADSLFSSGTVAMKKGNRNQALSDLDMASLYYRLAIAKQDLEKKNASIIQLEKSLAQMQEKLASYKKIINELENMR